jgi:hypothetical protein
MNSKAVYIFPFYSFNSEELHNNLQGFSKAEVKLLLTTLYLNVLENLTGKEEKLDIYCIWDENEKDNIIDELKNKNYNFIFADISNKKVILNKLSSKEFLSYKSNLIVFSEVIDIKSKDYDHYFNLLNIEEPSLVVAKDGENNIAAFGFNTFSEEIIVSLSLSEFNYNDFLVHLNSCKYFIHTVSNILLVRNINNFKQLYHNLSQKKSIEYCSQHMHEKFTDLFVEHKDLLK